MKKFIEFSVIVRYLFFLACASSMKLGETENEEQRENGYDCGSAFFTDKMVQDALKIASDTHGAQPYVGPLYDIQLGYMAWPIVQDKSMLQIKKVRSSHTWRQTKNQVIFDTHGNVIDVIVKIRNFDFAKCWRVGNSELELEIPDEVEINGYYCGQKLITKDDLKVPLSIARSKLGGHDTYPELYTGHLYKKELGYRVWPIYRGRGYYRTGHDQGIAYYIVIDPEGGLKDVIVRVLSHGKHFVRCMMSKKDLLSSSTSIQNKIIAESPKTGYDCNGIFFDDYDLQTARAMAMDTHKTRHRNIYPLRYEGPPFDSTCYLWPLQAFGRRIIPGNPQPYRLVLTLDFDIMCVVTKSGNTMKKCERTTIRGSHSKYNQNDYLCHNTRFSHQELSAAAKTGCLKFGGRQSVFPQKYTEVEFEVPGPYFIYPIIKGKEFKGRPGKHLVVMTYNCMVVGALTKEPRTGEVIKCKTIET